MDGSLSIHQMLRWSSVNYSTTLFVPQARIMYHSMRGISRARRVARLHPIPILAGGEGSKRHMDRQVAATK